MIRAILNIFGLIAPWIVFVASICQARIEPTFLCYVATIIKEMIFI